MSFNFGFNFWYRWLVAVTGAVMIYALCLIIFQDTMQALFDKLFFPNTHDYGADADATLNLVYGVLGAVLFGWMATLMGILLTSFRQGQRGAWLTIALSMLAWFSLDTGFSLYVGVERHAAFNIPFLVMFIIPLAATYRHFHPPTVG